MTSKQQVAELGIRSPYFEKIKQEIMVGDKVGFTLKNRARLKIHHPFSEKGEPILKDVLSGVEERRYQQSTRTTLRRKKTRFKTTWGDELAFNLCMLVIG